LAHTPSGTPVEVRVTSEGTRAVLEVRDHGGGLAPDQVDRVFDRFYRGPGAARSTGSGLGLFIVASLARAFGGEASVVSEPGEGATFTVVLPVDPGAAPATPATPAECDPVPEAPPTGRPADADLRGTAAPPGAGSVRR
jgi:two-component system OmpR family sensor kinase